MKKDQKTLNASLPRPPVVAVLGHVDHGKTTLLDFIRKTNIASREHGGITQSIGAYQVKLKAQSSKLKNEQEEDRLITFIDTPGHEAFSKMRRRGANVSDIAILVVAADDSVKPQTIESIEQIKAAQIPLIVAINKIDLPAANQDKVKADLAKAGVQVEGFGGDVPVIPVSAKSGTGVSDLLEMIYLMAQLKEFSNDSGLPLEAQVIEAQIDKGKGIIATLIIKKGKLVYTTPLFDGQKQIGKVRALFNDQGKPVVQALPGDPVEVLGFTELPEIGSILSAIVQAKIEIPPKIVELPSQTEEIPDFLKPIDDTKILKIILKADNSGSLEAIINSLNEKIKIVGKGVGDISDSDILLAKSNGAIIIGFGVDCKPNVAKLAQTEKVIYRNYKLIYELLDELTEVMKGFIEVIVKERELGRGTIIAQFDFDKQKVAGTKVSSGRLARGDSVKLMRNDQELVRVKIKSLRHGKEDTTKADTGTECGILFDNNVDFAPGDVIIAVTIG